MPPKKGPKKPTPGDNVRQYLAREAEVRSCTWAHLFARPVELPTLNVCRPACVLPLQVQKAKHAVLEQQNLSAVVSDCLPSSSFTYSEAYSTDPRTTGSL